MSYTFDQPITVYIPGRDRFSVSFRVNGDRRMNVGEIYRNSMLQGFSPNLDSEIAMAAKEAGERLAATVKFPVPTTRSAP